MANRNEIKTSGLKSDFVPGSLPEKSGVYVFRDRFGKVIYVGKAANLRKRVSTYFRPSTRQRGEAKVRSLVNSIFSWEVYSVRNEDEALLLESRLIKQYAPHYNVLMRDDKRFLMLKIDPDEKFPRLKLARLRKDDNCRYFGPFVHGKALKLTCEFLSAYFGLRSCKVAVPTERDHRHCLKRIVKDCCEPCVGKVSEAQYRERVEQMLKVIDGNIAPLLDELQSRMLEKAQAKSFEQAAKLRDVMENLKLCFGVNSRSFRFAKIKVEHDAGDAVGDLQQALKLANPPKVMECFDISNIGGEMAVGSMVHFENGKAQTAKYRRFRIRTVHQSDDFAMMAEVLKRHYARKLSENQPLPDLIVVDGGKGQLSAALNALVAIKMPPTALLGLAKKHEEIFVPGRDESIKLDHDRPALKLLQALRDEAHRFAISYHRELRSKRIRESLLDEIPHIGASRKRQLLISFGSIERLKRASVDQIIEKTPGIGRNFAERIYRFLHKA